MRAKFGTLVAVLLALWAALALVTAVTHAAAPSHFAGWRKFGADDNASVFYYFPASVKPIYYAGVKLGTYVWAGWQNSDGSYNQGRYSFYCGTGTYSLTGDVVGNASGTEAAGDEVLERPYRPGTFAWLLATVVCH